MEPWRLVILTGLRMQAPSPGPPCAAWKWAAWPSCRDGEVSAQIGKGGGHPSDSGKPTTVSGSLSYCPGRSLALTSQMQIIIGGTWYQSPVAAVTKDPKSG
ncbi:hypothetical protein H1C71_023308, partial [Ictidomys tridecemlineatus]